MITPIIILILLSSPLLVMWVIGKIKGTNINKRKYAFWGLGAAFVFFSIGHFVKTDGMIEMLPSWVPFRLELIYATGVLEVFVGISLFISRLQRKAAFLAIVILVVFFPANIYAAMYGIGLGGHQWGPVYLLVRAPLQIILIAWAYCLCIKNISNSKEKY